METKAVFSIFPGQGSQQVGMGKELYENSPLAKELFDQANDALGFSLSDICFEGPEDKLKNTAIAQPAILTTSFISFSLVQEQLEVCAAAGHSLGEYTALVAAGALSFTDAVKLVHKRGTFMQEAVPVGAGKMSAVLGKEVEEIEEAIAKVEGEVVEVANINAPGQVVVAGTAAGVEKFLEALGTAKTVELPVSAPFHCSLMKPAADRLAEELRSITINAPKCPVYANVSATAVTEPEAIRQSLIDQVCGRVRWVECIQNGISEQSPSIAIEFGKGNTLTGLLKRIDRKFPKGNIYDGSELNED